MSEDFKKVVASRFMSLLWRVVGMMVAVFLATATDYINVLHLNTELTVLAGLLIGELTKFLNSNYPWLRNGGDPVVK